MNNKLLSGILVVGIAATGFAGYSSADDTNTWAGLSINGEQVAELNADTNSNETKKNKHGKRKWFTSLTDAEKLSLESMSDDEKKAFFTGKKEEKAAEREVTQAIMSKLFNGEDITVDERATLQAKQAEHEAKHADKPERTENSEKAGYKAVVAKLIAGENLTADEQTVLDEIKAKKATRDAIKPLIEKKKAGEELTESEQAELDSFKADNSKKKWGKKGGKKWNGENRGNKTEKIKKVG